MATDSILDTTKKALGISADYTAFDIDIVMHINSVFSTLNQLGLGPTNGFSIEDNSTNWDSYLNGDDRLSAVKSYMVLRVRLLFDPPATSFAIDSFKEQIKELEWRLNVEREYEAYPIPVVAVGG